jgi:hypothetical protein
MDSGGEGGDEGKLNPPYNNYNGIDIFYN